MYRMLLVVIFFVLFAGDQAWLIVTERVNLLLQRAGIQTTKRLIVLRDVNLVVDKIASVYQVSSLEWDNPDYVPFTMEITGNKAQFYDETDIGGAKSHSPIFATLRALDDSKSIIMGPSIHAFDTATVVHGMYTNDIDVDVRSTSNIAGFNVFGMNLVEFHVLFNIAKDWSGKWRSTNRLMLYKNSSGVMKAYIEFSTYGTTTNGGVWFFNAGTLNEDAEVGTIRAAKNMAQIIAFTMGSGLGNRPAYTEAVNRAVAILSGADRKYDNYDPVAGIWMTAAQLTAMTAALTAAGSAGYAALTAKP